MQDHGVIDADIIWTKTAGFGLIDPRHVRNQDDLPKNGNALYTIDLPARQIAVKAAGIELHQVSALLLTTHEPEKDAPLPISEGDRNNFLTRNQATITSIERRLDASLAASQSTVVTRCGTWNR